MADSAPQINSARSRYLLLIMMLIPIGVVSLATLVFYTRMGMPEGTRNKGTLIVPPVQINSIKLQNGDGVSFLLDGAKDNSWVFLVAHSADCDESCKKKFWEIRQTRIALGKYQSYIRRVWLVTGGMIDSSTQQWLAKEHADVTVIYADSYSWKNLLQASVKNGVADDKNIFFLVDPRGFVMMYYALPNTYKDVIADMKFLLKGAE